MHPIASRPTRAHLHSHALGNAAHTRLNARTPNAHTRCDDAHARMLACSHARKQVTQCREEREQGCKDARKHGNTRHQQKHGSTHAHIDASMEAWKHGSMQRRVRSRSIIYARRGCRQGCFQHASSARAYAGHEHAEAKAPAHVLRMCATCLKLPLLS